LSLCCAKNDDKQLRYLLSFVLWSCWEEEDNNSVIVIIFFFSFFFGYKKDDDNIVIVPSLSFFVAL
jgi:hypothetical protein